MDKTPTLIRALFLSLILGVNHSATAASILSADADGTFGLATSGVAATGSSGSVTQSDGGSNANGSFTSQATASFGVLQVYGEAHSGATGSAGSLMFGLGQAFWQDTMMIDKAGLTGTSGTVNMKFTLSGSLTSTAAGWGGVGSTAKATASYDLYKDNMSSSIASASQVVRADGTISGNILGVEQIIPVSFIYGTPFDIRLKASARGDAYLTYGGDSVANLGSAVTWGGFGDVLDNTSSVVTGYAFSSDSGTNFTQSLSAAPEPTKGALTLAGCVLACLRRRRTI